MYVSLNEYETTWNQLKKETLSHSSCRIVLFVSCLDVDALCSAKILSNLLQKDLIPHKTMPVVGLASLKEAYQQLDEDITNVICVGCGSNVDLQDYLGMDQSQRSRPKIHIIDNHRPWNLSNLFGSDDIICYDDGSVENLQDYKTAYEFLAENEADSDESDHSGAEEAEDDDEDEHKDDDDESIKDDDDHDEDRDVDDDQESAATQDTQETTQASQTAVTAAAPEATQLDENQTETINDDVDTLPKRRRTLRSMYTQKLMDYQSQGSYLYSADTIQVYTLLTMIGESSARSLWLTVVGVTALEPQYPEIYASLYPVLKDEINRLSSGREFKTTGGTNNDLSFAIETDYSFFLLRQWSLYESMIHSSYLSAKLYLWTDDGRKNLHKMLAKMGISLQDAREQWVYMNPPLKRMLKSKLESVSGMYGIESIIRDGVVRKFGYKGGLSAGDCSESIAALLETGKRQIGNIESTADPEGRSTSPALAASERQQFWVENFWVAWDSSENFDRLVTGMTRAKLLQQAVVATGTAIFEKGQLKDLHSFRLAVIRDGPDIEIFKNPLSLARLGVWISEGCAEIHAQPLPLVVATFDELNDKYLVLGMGPRKSREEATVDTVYNQFGQAFQATGTLINAKISIDAFESSIIEVSRDDLSRFLEALAIEMRK